MPEFIQRSDRLPPAYVLSKGPWWDLLFWLAYGLVSHVVFAPATFRLDNLLFSAFFTGGQAAATYLHLRLLLRPRLEGRLRVATYVFGVLATTLLFTLAYLVVLHLFFEVGPIGGLTWLDVQTFAGVWLGPIMGGLGMALSITAGLFLYGRHRRQEQREASLLASQQATELAYLRGQLNPHFLFNALNGIYVLIPRDPQRAQTALGGFSDLLRYQLYQSEQKTVPLENELQHLAQFADLHLLRAEEDFQYTFTSPGPGEVGNIPPMLLLPLLENAFKYSPSVGAQVSGSATIRNNRLHFELRNLTAPTAPVTDPGASGVGLNNIRRRLQLLFPGDYTLDTENGQGDFSVRLEIPLQ